MSRALLTVTGSVQGVGFRPFVHRLATQLGLSGHVRNTSQGVEIEVQGEEKTLATFQQYVRSEKPERARIDAVKVQPIPDTTTLGFSIVPSVNSLQPVLALLPDTATCNMCLQEYLDPSNRRYRYPFIHCTSCGPRFSLFERMPFDRETTTMVDFPMCDQCLREYNDPHDRRFFSQTTCCPSCGPKLQFHDTEGNTLASNQAAIELAIDALRRGDIIAFKNTGGYLLLVDATDEQAVQRLRRKKRRPTKPFALLVSSIAEAESIAHVTPTASSLLTSPQAPIVLLPKKPLSNIAPSVAPNCPTLGLMLPHSAALYSVIKGVQRPLVATSGNSSGRPLCISEGEAFEQLTRIADGFVTHNRRITHRLDDSVVQLIDNQPMIIRRARGYIPYAISLPDIDEATCCIGAGGHHKNSFAIAARNTLYISQHIGDLDTADSCEAYEKEICSWEKLLSSTPTCGMADPHPGYFSTSSLKSLDIPMEYVHHHRAHVWSGMVDARLTAPVLAVSWDGTGFGEDHTIWGGESFVVDERGIRRVATLYPFKLVGGEAAIAEPRRSALGLFNEIAGHGVTEWLESAFTQQERTLLTTALHKSLNAPVCSSMGRLFDGVSALLTHTLVSNFEGEAALALETLALSCERTELKYSMPLVQDLVMDWRAMVISMVNDMSVGAPYNEMALAFHQALADSIVHLAKQIGIAQVLLTGGVMQNRLLMELAIAGLRSAGFCPFWNQQIPPNDGGLAVGQIIGALRRRPCV